MHLDIPLKNTGGKKRSASDSKWGESSGNKMIEVGEQMTLKVLVTRFDCSISVLPQIALQVAKYSSLHLAASNGWVDMVRFLMENGANINEQSKVRIGVSTSRMIQCESCCACMQCEKS